MKHVLLSGLVCLVASVATLATLAPNALAGESPKSPLDFKMKNIDGKEVKLSHYRGSVVLIVNTASKCGFTPQYASLETLYEKYKDQGLKILAFPSNDFAQQDPGADSEIKQFCTTRYNTKFDLFSKIVTKGDGQAPLYTFLTSDNTNPGFSGQIGWNFTKFLVNRQGKVVARFNSPIDPLSPEFVTAVETALKEK